MSKVTSLQIGSKKIGLVLRASSKEGDYTDLISENANVSSNTKFIIPHNGILYYRDSLRGDAGAISISINGTELYYQNCTSYSYASSNAFTYPVKKNDLLEINPISHS